MKYSITTYIGMSATRVIETFTAESDEAAVSRAKSTGRKSGIGLVVNVYRGNDKVGRPVSKKSVRVATI